MGYEVSEVFWPVALVLGAGAFLTRLSFIQLLDKVEIPGWAHRLLRFIPAAVLPAIIAPAVLSSHGGAGPDPARAVAACVAAAVAWRTRNTLLTIFAGMGSLWGLQAVL